METTIIFIIYNHDFTHYSFIYFNVNVHSKVTERAGVCPLPVAGKTSGWWCRVSGQNAYCADCDYLKRAIFWSIPAMFVVKTWEICGQYLNVFATNKCLGHFISGVFMITWNVTNFSAPWLIVIVNADAECKCNRKDQYISLPYVINVSNDLNMLLDTTSWKARWIQQ